ncbi:MAG: helix-turn-helix transcriptional regulator [Phycisphaerae bacterium]|nr:helix-turn-helix transcriptional regulator [Phycisphaerae bacterium]
MTRSWVGHSWTTLRPGVAPRIVSAHYVERPPWGMTGRSLHQFWVLDYARSPCGRVRVGSQRAAWRTREPRTAHLYSPGTPYWEDTTGVRGPIREAWVIFDGGDEAGLRRLFDRGRRWAHLADPAGLLDEPLREMALNGHARGEAAFWQGQAALAGVIDLLGRAVRQDDMTLLLTAQVEPPADPTQDLVRRADDYFQAHLADKITLADVASHLGASSSALSHRYSELTGRSPMAVLAAMRIELSKSLLLRGLKMEVIAQQTGFFDAFHFSKAFKKHCGTSPSRFRRQGGAAPAGSPGK